ncbi:MAG: hypothetical protein HDR01_00745 [Lachnospiraceae bacterium]|nr:hypothetical protein [Lachnospiraceae bacterium]
MTKLVKETKKKANEKDTITVLLEYMVALFSFVLVIFLPIYLKEGFYKIGNAKYTLYANITKPVLPILTGMVILYFICNYKKWNVQRVLKNLSLLDYMVIIYLLFVLLSSALSEYPDKIWAGYSGWFMGLYSQISFACIYFLVSRYARNAMAIMFCLCGTAGYVYLMGILNRFLIDPLGVYEGLDEYYKLQFLSTLGQASWYSAFVCTVLPIGLYFFWSSKKRWVRIASGIFSFLGFSTLVTQNSDSAYIALLCFMGAFLWFAVEDIWHLQRFFQLVMLFLLSVKVMYIGTIIRPENMIGSLDTLSQFLIGGSLTWVLLIVCAFIWGILLLCQKKGIYNRKVMKIIRNLIYMVVGIAIVLAVVLLVLGANGLLSENVMVILRQIPYLTWSDYWGSGRGFTWRFTGNMFKNMSLGKKIFGVGPECYSYYGYEFAAADLNAKWGNNILTNAHNEWLTAVINYGVLGGIAYLGIFVSAVAGFAKKAAKSPVLIGIIACIFSYGGHNLFCYQTVLCTPFIFILMGIGEWYARQENEAI